ncbi:hypothetical protein HMI55_006013 [Coelomomyces lativittatus]|nr:hypothetical protein HMI55_006013 [Coelomomyces lativittatus]
MEENLSSSSSSSSSKIIPLTTTATTPTPTVVTHTNIPLDIHSSSIPDRHSRVQDPSPTLIPPPRFSSNSLGSNHPSLPLNLALDSSSSSSSSSTSPSLTLPILTTAPTTTTPISPSSLSNTLLKEPQATLSTPSSSLDSFTSKEKTTSVTTTHQSNAPLTSVHSPSFTPIPHGFNALVTPPLVSNENNTHPTSTPAFNHVTTTPPSFSEPPPVLPSNVADHHPTTSTLHAASTVPVPPTHTSTPASSSTLPTSSSSSSSLPPLVSSLLPSTSQVSSTSTPSNPPLGSSSTTNSFTPSISNGKPDSKSGPHAVGSRPTPSTFTTSTSTPTSTSMKPQSPPQSQTVHAVYHPYSEHQFYQLKQQFYAYKYLNKNLPFPSTLLQRLLNYTPSLTHPNQVEPTSLKKVTIIDPWKLITMPSMYPRSFYPSIMPSVPFTPLPLQTYEFKERQLQQRCHVRFMELQQVHATELKESIGPVETGGLPLSSMKLKALIEFKALRLVQKQKKVCGGCCFFFSFLFFSFLS